MSLFIKEGGSGCGVWGERWLGGARDVGRGGGGWGVVGGMREGIPDITRSSPMPHKLPGLPAWSRSPAALRTPQTGGGSHSGPTSGSADPPSL